MPRVFVSYSRQDQLFVRRLVTDLEHFGADIWLDLDDIPLGAKWSTEIQKGLDTSTIMLVIISPYSMSSTNVEEEWQYFLDQKKSIVPILHEQARIHFQLNRLQYVDFVSQDYMTAFRQLHAQLAKEGIPLHSIPDDFDSGIPLRQRDQSPAFQAAEERSIKYRTATMGAVQSAPRLPRRGALIGAGLIVVLLAILGLLVILPRLSPGKITPTVVVAAVTNTVNAAAIDPTSTPTAQPSATSTNTPLPTASATHTATIVPTATATTAPSLTATPATPTVAPTLPPGSARYDGNTVSQVWVPAGCFKMGSEDNDPLAEDDEKPAHPVCITRGYWIDAYEVTNADYQKFVDDGGYTKRTYWTDDGWNWLQKYHVTGPHYYATANALRQPRVGIAFYEAEAYAHWRGGRLPTEAEWEYAARGPNAQVFPWGDQWQPGIANANNAGGDPNVSQAVAVGTFPKNKSWVGAFDLSGNVDEFVSDWYDAQYYRMMVKDDPQGPPAGTAKVVRGGAFDSTTKSIRASNRIVYPDFILGSMRIGMRVVSEK